ncbi:MAG: 23S rRNA (adenine(2503)-C(2))-methyltransferase RlmN, partial [Dysgonamonadaceae bacterium]|nr:23S rRNA (adenine(2503)-C(2))-methyltransferase RlmN [Dysgonamonadaceae bacterium]
MKTTEFVSSDKIALLGKTSDELKSIVESLGMPSYTAAQLAKRLYGSKVFSIDDITEISKINREKLKEKYVTGRRLPSASQRSIDGTTKYLFQTDNGKFIETVCIPEKERTTICISTQIGCKMNCSFCMTGKQGFSGNLSSAEILNQILSVP